MRVVLDTNVIVSRYVAPHGPVARILESWDRRAFDVVTSDVVLLEYARVLRYPRLRRTHKLTDNQLEAIDGRFRTLTQIVEPVEIPTVIINDPDDDHILACAVSGDVDCIISGDPHLLNLGSYKGIPILSPAAFLERFFPD